MNANNLSTLASVLLFTSLATAEPALAGPGGPEGHGGPGGPHGVLDLLIGRPGVDSDGDGRITPKERKAARAADFKTIAGEDGYISLQELKDWKISKTTARFSALDTDANGQLSLAEFTADRTERAAVIAKNLFNIGDTNTDGSLSSEEFQTLAQAILNPIVPFAAMDADSDGKLSEAEFTTPPRGPGRKGKGGGRDAQ